MREMDKKEPKEIKIWDVDEKRSRCVKIDEAISEGDVVGIVNGPKGALRTVADVGVVQNEETQMTGEKVYVVSDLMDEKWTEKFEKGEIFKIGEVDREVYRNMHWLCRELFQQYYEGKEGRLEDKIGCMEG